MRRVSIFVESVYVEKITHHFRRWNIPLSVTFTRTARATAWNNGCGPLPKKGRTPLHLCLKKLRSLHSFNDRGLTESLWRVSMWHNTVCFSFITCSYKKAQILMRSEEACSHSYCKHVTAFLRTNHKSPEPCESVVCSCVPKAALFPNDTCVLQLTWSLFVSDNRIYYICTEI
jgi:hypothetical protein